MRLHDRLAGERAPLIVRQQHDLDGLEENHASRRAVGERRVIDGASRLVEGIGREKVPCTCTLHMVFLQDPYLALRSRPNVLLTIHD